MNKGYARKLSSSSGIELVCEFLGRTMCNHNQFLLSIVSYFCYLFGEFAEVLIYIVERVMSESVSKT